MNLFVAESKPVVASRVWRQRRDERQMRRFSVREMVWILIVVVSEVHILSKFIKLGASLEAQMVKNLPAIQETQVQSLGQEDPLEKGMATHSSILA